MTPQEKLAETLTSLGEAIGDRDAQAHFYSALVVSNQPVVRQQAKVMGVMSEELIEEIAQDVFVAVFIQMIALLDRQAIDLSRSVGELCTYVTKTCRRQTTRSTYRLRSRSLPHQIRAVPHFKDAQVLLVESEFVSRCLTELAPIDRDIIVLRYVKGRSARQVGAICGMSESHVRTRCTRSLSRLRKSFSGSSRRGMAVT